MHDGQRRILVAEDDHLVRDLIVEVLSDAGYDVLKASSGIEAVRLMENPGGINAVVSDLNMPGMDGLEVARQARMHHPGVPVLFVTARPDLLRASPPPEPFRYLTKPFRVAELTQVVTALLDGNHGSAWRVH